MLLTANKIEKISLQIPVRKIDTQITASILRHLRTIWQSESLNSKYKKKPECVHISNVRNQKNLKNWFERKNGKK